MHTCVIPYSCLPVSFRIHAFLCHLLLRFCLIDQDSVRLLAVESCGAFAAALSREDCQSHLLPVVQKFAQVRLP